MVCINALADIQGNTKEFVNVTEYERKLLKNSFQKC